MFVKSGIYLKFRSVFLIGCLLMIFGSNLLANNVRAAATCCCQLTDTNGDGEVDTYSSTCESIDVNSSDFYVCEDEKGDDWSARDQAYCVVQSPAESPVNFVPNVSIPSLSGTNVFTAGQATPVASVGYDIGGKKFLSSSLLTNYLVTWYELLVYLAGFLAFFMIVWGGFKWMWGAGNEELIGSAKHTIVDAVMGLLLALGAYLVLQIVNPNLTGGRSQGLLVQYVERRELQDEEFDGNNLPLNGNQVNLNSGGALVIVGSVTVTDTVQQALDLATNNIQGTAQILVTSGLRTSEQQLAQIRAGCPADAQRSSDCRPSAVCLMGGPPNYDRPGGCPHVSGRAVDVWGAQNGAQCITKPECLQKPSLDDCRRDPCQLAIGKAMELAGFCNLRSEPWHFEYMENGQGVSSSCALIYTDL